MKSAKTYREELVKKIYELKNIDRSKHFTKNELILIDNVYDSVLQVIELEMECEDWGSTALPCKVGDIGFAFSCELKEVVPYCVDEIHIDEYTITFEGYVDNENGDELDRETFTADEVGKVIFFGDNAEAEAQQAHANRMKGAPEWMTKEVKE